MIAHECTALKRMTWRITGGTTEPELSRVLTSARIELTKDSPDGCDWRDIKVTVEDDAIVVSYEVRKP